jgi:hypothetical protein
VNAALRVPIAATDYALNFLEMQEGPLQDGDQNHTLASERTPKKAQVTMHWIVPDRNIVKRQ